jgi:lysozyme
MKLHVGVAAAFLLSGAVGFSACTGESEPPVDEQVAEAEDAMTVCAGPNVVKGIDVSYYQGTIDWGAVSGAGWRFAITRINDGSFMDPKFDENWAGIKNAGMIRGAYQFFRPGNDAAEQAQVVIDKVGQLGPGDLPVTIDVEATDGQSPTTIANKITTWMELVEAGTGKKPIIYTGKYFWQDNVQSGAFSDYPLWHAQYPNACLPPNDPPPACGCANIADQWATWTIWQYTSTGSIPGIGTNVDKNVFMGTEDDLIAFANQGGYGATVVSVEAPSTVLAGEAFTAKITVQNSGGMPWDGGTRLGTTEPRDRTSAFYDASWLDQNRVAAVEGAVALGGSYTFELTMHAPADVGAYVEHFGLVQEAVTWFADQGGPADTDIAIAVQVIDGPAPNGVGSGSGGGGTGGEGAGGGDADDDGSSDSSCDCGVPGGPTPSAPWGAVAGLASALAWVHRRRRAR